MEIQIITLDKLSYEDLSQLLSSVRKNIKEVDALLADAGQKKATEISEQEWRLFKKHMFLTKLKEQLLELAFDHASTVKLPEGI